ncbi:MAG TPA: glycosyltransferase [Kofleriaceae bacterium]
MARLEEVELASWPIDRFAPLIGEDRMRETAQSGASRARQLRGRTWWHVNSTARGGGVAEILQSLLCYARGFGIDTRWLVIEGTAEFFQLTKRLHHALHGAAGDGSPLGDAERAIYEAVLADNAAAMLERVRPGDVVLLHDPQTAGLAPALQAHGAIVAWRCHVGADFSNAHTDLAWQLLAPYLAEVPATIFSRHAYIPTALDARRAVVVEPSIDPFSAKNQPLDEPTTRSILVHAGLIDGPPGEAEPVYRADDGTHAVVRRKAEVIRTGRPTAWTTPLVVQVSRWDPLKDPIGVIRGFAEQLDSSDPIDADLVFAGPNVSAVTDDPEGAETFRAAVNAWRALPDASRARIHLASLPMADREENAAIVNALQRHAAIVLQKSLREGFGLTITEAMWKGRPVIASATGGIQDQIDHAVHGLLLQEPRDLAAYGLAIRRLLRDPAMGARLGEAARAKVRDHLLTVRELTQYLDVVARIDPAR